MSLLVSLKVWEVDINGRGVVPEMPHVGHRLFFVFHIKQPHPTLKPECAAKKMSSLTIWLYGPDIF